MLLKDHVKPDPSTKAELLHLYRSDNRPWVVAFSGGKDSTVVLQLVFEMLMENRQFAGKLVFVIFIYWVHASKRAHNDGSVWNHVSMVRRD